MHLKWQHSDGEARKAMSKGSHMKTTRKTNLYIAQIGKEKEKGSQNSMKTQSPVGKICEKRRRGY